VLIDTRRAPRSDEDDEFVDAEPTNGGPASMLGLLLEILNVPPVSAGIDGGGIEPDVRTGVEALVRPGIGAERPGITGAVAGREPSGGSAEDVDEPSRLMPPEELMAIERPPARAIEPMLVEPLGITGAMAAGTISGAAEAVIGLGPSKPALASVLEVLGRTTAGLVVAAMEAAGGPGALGSSGIAAAIAIASRSSSSSSSASSASSSLPSSFARGSDSASPSCSSPSSSLKS